MAQHRTYLCLLLLLLAGFPSGVEAGRFHSPDKQQSKYDSILHSSYIQYKDCSISELESCFDTMISIATAEGSRYGRTMGNFGKALCLVIEGRVDDGLRYCSVAEAAMDRADPPMLLGFSSYVNGVICIYTEHNVRAIVQLENALDFFTQASDSLFIFKTYLQLGAVYSAMFKKSYADKYFHLAESIAPKYMLYHLDLNVASSLVLSNPDSALLVCQKILDSVGYYGADSTNITPKSAQFWCNFYNIQCSAAIQLADYEMALQAVDRMQVASDCLNMDFCSNQVASLRSDILFKQGRYKEAADILLTQFNRVGGTFKLKRQEDAAQGLMKCYEAMGDYREAYRFSQVYIALRDSIAAQYYDLDEIFSDREDLASAQMQNLDEQRRLAQRNSTILIVLSLLLLVGVAVLFLIRRMRLRMNQQLIQQQQALIDEKQTELVNSKESQMNSIAHIRELSEQIKELLMDASIAKPVQTVDIDPDLEDLMQSGNWNLFQSLFRKQYPDFLPTLQEKYPDLSSTNQKLCMLIKVGRTNKEIASMLHLTPDSVKTYRLHLRRALGITNSQTNLNDFVQSL